VGAVSRTDDPTAEVTDLLPVAHPEPVALNDGQRSRSGEEDPQRRPCSPGISPARATTRFLRAPARPPEAWCVSHRGHRPRRAPRLLLMGPHRRPCPVNAPTAGRGDSVRCRGGSTAFVWGRGRGSTCLNLTASQAGRVPSPLRQRVPSARHADLPGRRRRGGASVAWGRRVAAAATSARRSTPTTVLTEGRRVPDPHAWPGTASAGGSVGGGEGHLLDEESACTGTPRPRLRSPFRTDNALVHRGGGGPAHRRLPAADGRIHESWHQFVRRSALRARAPPKRCSARRALADALAELPVGGRAATGNGVATQHPRFAADRRGTAAPKTNVIPRFSSSSRSTIRTLPGQSRPTKPPRAVCATALGDLADAGWRSSPTTTPATSSTRRHTVVGLAGAHERGGCAKGLRAGAVAHGGVAPTTASTAAAGAVGLRLRPVLAAPALRRLRRDCSTATTRRSTRSRWPLSTQLWESRRGTISWVRSRPSSPIASRPPRSVPGGDATTINDESGPDPAHPRG